MSYPKALLSSRSNEWYTPHDLFETLHEEFEFNLDPCATDENAKCKRYFTQTEDGLVQDWETSRVFCNPPYGRCLPNWTRKCFEASQDGALVVALLPASTSTRWFHDWVLGKAELRFIKGRLKFGGRGCSAPFSSLLAIYRPTNCIAELSLAA